MNKKILSTLAYDEIKQAIYQYLVSDAGRAELASLEPIADGEKIREWLDETKDGADVLRLEGGISLPKLEDIAPQMKRLEIQGTLSGTELAHVSRVLKTTEAMTTFFDRLQEKEVELRRLYAFVGQISALPEIVERLKRSVEDDGRILDTASVELAQIRHQISRTEATIRSKMEGYTRGNDAKYLSEGIVTIRDGRFVIPVKAENKSHFGGIVHDQSATGQTLFIEPGAVVELNNQLRQHQMAEQQEERRVLTDLSDLLRPYQPEIEHNAVILGHLDFINAKARYAHQLKATEPAISEANIVKLRGARHPLIDPKRVVANDIAIGEDYKAIIVTGPNTGGKTITLKTLGLAQLMGQSGLFISANENSQIGIFSAVFADIGDEQSIEQNLSTFSSHMDNIGTILNQADQRSLILLDEVGAGTDPQEGAALAMAILDDIGSIGSYVVATTHYPELKAFGYNRADTINASMEFDTETLKPTYRLLIGIPGRSNAFEIAARLGIKPSIIAEARELTNQDNQDINNMIADLTAQKKAAEEEASQLEIELAEATAIHDELKTRFNKLETQKDRLIEDAKDQANKIVNDTRSRANEIISDLHKKQIAANQSVKENELIAAKGAINALQQDPSLKKNKVLQREKRRHDFKKGDEVFVKSYGQMGTLMKKLSDTEWEVQMGIIKMKIDEVNLDKIKPEATKVKAPRATIRRSGSSGMSPTLDLRGKRYEEAMAEVDRYIDSALLAGYPSITIIHGKGTGALRKGVTEYLKSNKRVKEFGFSPANAGGDGSTIVKF
ncbi:DNA mismatch repair protein MutS [Secundilactobacillus oryzae JCM 18671]|uniref:Endonuclease MutS2 n=1 Tax=Secundilactobacillus oryzae JCM 18671 TaxID=1291743 RepID=A0A081BJ11_9LACO|nr:endonuclease MutS2 [Secundilactobacillus oryzae]GAK48029.1 DNA mismatch repair protein MutS [Secundilactobacillus oryzae JCM 18671]